MLQVPQVLSLEDRSKSGLFDASCAQPVSWLARTVELVVELVVDIDVSCCLLDHFVSDPRGTGAVLINLCSSRHRKGRMSSFWEPQSSQGHQSCSNQIKGSKATAKGRKEEYMVEEENSVLWATGFCLDQGAARVIQDFQWTRFARNRNAR